VEQRLAATPQVAWYAGNLGRGNPQIFYNENSTSRTRPTPRISSA